MLFPWSHECVGGEVHRWWRCSGAHRGQTGGYGQQSLSFSCSLFISMWLTSLSHCLCVTTRRAEQQWARSEDGDVEVPSWTTGQRGYGTWWGWKWTPWWAELRPSSRNWQHGRWYLLHALHIVYLLTFCSSSLCVCKDIFLLNFDCKIMQNIFLLVNTFLI